MKSKTSKILLTVLCFVLVFACFPFLYIASVSADSATVANFIRDFGATSENSQELTSTINSSFTTDFGDSTGVGTTNGWSIPSFSGTEIKQVNAGDFTSDATIGYNSEKDVKFSEIGTDGNEGNKFALLFLLKEKGIAGIESGEIKIPARGLFVLTFNAKVGKLANLATNYGINAKILEVSGGKTVKTYSMDAIKTVTEDYQSYAFVIQGNEYEEKTIKIQFLFGNAVEENGVTTKNEQIGYAVVDTIHFFGATYAQFNSLATDKNAKKVSFLSENSNYVNIGNGYFNITENQKWNLADNTSLSDFRPLKWTQEGGENATYGIVNTNSAAFTERMAQLGITAVNPENGSTSNNNVLMMYNSSASYQTITSESFKLSSKSYYEISFRFNTPANAEQTNNLSFFLVDKDGKTIYSKENMFSYVEHSESANEWAIFHVFIKTTDDAKELNFVIKFGTKEKQTSGYAFVDDVRLYTTRTSDSMFNNTQKDTFELVKEENETETKYLKEGIVSFDELKKLNQESASNRSMSVYDYTVPVNNNTTNDDNKDDNNKDNNSSSSSLAWYVVPSVLFAVCLIGGLIIFYTRKIKIKKHPRKKKTSYDRKKTLNKQVEQRERSEAALQKGNYEAQLENVRKEIEELENEYEKSEKDKKSPLALEKYLAKREKLQNKETKLVEQIKKLK